MQQPVLKALFATALFSVGACSNADQAADPAVGGGVVNVYSSRHYDADAILFERFERETGIKVNLIEGQGDGLIERLAREGEASPADVFLTADAGMLWRAESRGLFRPVDDARILDRVPAQYRDPQNEWVGLARRARIIVYNKAAGLPDGLDTYEDLADPALAGTICVRTSSNVYNQSLLAGIVAHNGAEAAEAWARGVVANMARKPQGNDTSQIEAVAAGECRVAIVNSYYIARMTGSEDPAVKAIADKVGVFFPSQNASGAHVNISGAGVAKHAANIDNAHALLRFLLTDESQRVFAEANNEYPVVPGVDASSAVRQLGEFRADDLPVAALGENQPEAIRIFDRVGWL